MKKILIASILVLFILPVLVHAQVEPKIKTLVFVGKGIAVSPNDPLDFRMVKAGVGSVKVSLAGETTELKVGVLILDGEKYKLKNIVDDSDGGVSGDVYRNNSRVGSFSVSSVLKDDITVWAGKLEVNGETFNLYILEASRKARPDEIREKISDYCKANKNDPNCRQRMAEYCKNNLDDSRCKEIFRRYCKNNLDDSRCREYIRSYCDKNPEIEDCRVFVVKRTAKFCKEHPNSEHCIEIEKRLVEWCLKNPQTQRCKKFCSEHPKKCLKVVKSLADFCMENPENKHCVRYCKEHPVACKKLAKNLVELCAKNPDSTKCIDYCKEHPVACKKVTAELANFCIGRENNPRCVSFCKEHENACKKVSIELEGYCAKHADTLACKRFCEKFPEKCKVAKPVEVEIEGKDTSVLAGETKQVEQNTGETDVITTATGNSTTVESAGEAEKTTAEHTIETNGGE